ncbi:DEAD/DEAH box helicase [Methanolobus sp.]|uniref:DEAD/DEAH box helicase n=1 Tax=Methanolobus sp. TaxID=1874737 RepID=UPI0025E8B05A|nr:DEAD/DEAH box helicase [Methanolobus sp.]
MEIPQLIDKIKSSRKYEGQITHIEDVPTREAGYKDIELNPLIRYALRENGIEQLYIHQADAVEIAREKKNIVLSTSTASGKSMCYMLPVFERLLEEPHATALYISPLNALVNDQLETFRKLSQTMGLNVNIDRFVGSMSKAEKDAVKYGNTKIIFTNPEMLHLSFLQWKHQWKHFLSNLNFIILDESHSYTGVMGSHMANLLRRLNRVCEHYGSNPQYICCTATIGNPVEHSSSLTGKDVTLIDNDSSGQSAQKFVFWNPPLYANSRKFTQRKASFGETVDLFTTFVQNDLQTIVFARSRQKVERMYVQAKNTLASRGVDKKISPYRGGYHGNEREAIEKDLSQGNIDGVISTNALELGIDIGGLDACIMDGFPGTIMSARQQAGRAGRGRRESIVTLVADSNALDQYYMRNPEDFFRRKCEEAVINVSNRYIQAVHLLCAAKELPLRTEDSEHFGFEFETIVKVLEEEGLLEGLNEKRSLDPNPHMKVSIRSIDNDNYTIIEKTSRKPLEKDIEKLRAYREAFEGAVYINKGTPYCVTKQNHEKKEIHVEVARDGYYTKSLVSSDIVIKEVVETKALPTFPDVKVGFGDVDVTQQVTGYKKFQQRTDTELGQLSLDMPEFRLETEALWLELPYLFTEMVNEHERDFAGGIHAIEHAMIAMYPLHLLADRNDVGGVSTPEHDDLSGNSGIFVYDGHPGGVGYAESGYGKIVEMLELTLQIDPFDSGCLYIVDTSTGNLDIVVHKGLSSEYVAKVSHYGANSLLTKMVMIGKPVYKNHSEICAMTATESANEKLNVTALVPVKRGDEVIALLKLMSHNQNEVSTDSQNSLENIASQIGGFINRTIFEIELKNNNNDLLGIFESLEDFLFIVDLEGCIINYNSAVPTRLGYSKEELLGTNIISIIPYKLYLKAAKTFFDIIEGMFSYFTFPLIAKDKSLISVAIRFTRSKWKGQDVMIGISHDVTNGKSDQ